MSQQLSIEARRRALQVVRILAAPRELVLRRRGAKTLLGRSQPPLHVDALRGYVRFGPETLTGTSRLLERCRGILGDLRPHLDRIHARSTGKFRLTADLFSDELHARDGSFVEFAAQDGVLSIVVEYLGTVPYLARLALPHSIHLPETTAPAYHQRFHVDNDDFRQVKLFLYVGEVGIEDGPLSFLPADVSARVLDSLAREGRPVSRAGTFTDEEVFRYCDRSELVVLTGPPGTGAFLDLSRCLHFGSRVAPGRERCVLAAAYLRYHRLVENASSQIDPAIAGEDPVRRLLLRSPRRRPLGYFCPDPLSR